MPHALSAADGAYAVGNDGVGDHRERYSGSGWVGYRSSDSLRNSALGRVLAHGYVDERHLFLGEREGGLPSIQRALQYSALSVLLNWKEDVYLPDTLSIAHAVITPRFEFRTS